VNSISRLEWLQARKAEAEADVAALNRLIEREKHSTNGHVTESKPRPPKKNATRPIHVRGAKHAFKPDPESAASRTLSQVRQILEEVAGKALPFANVIQRLSRDLVGTAKGRQNVRQALLRSGKRAGIEYVDATCVRLLT
jgi:hypothetical protein